jgi:hypothetical protein
MSRSMKCFGIASLAVFLALSAAFRVDARDKTVSGTWALTVEHLSLPLVLAQKKQAVAGSLAYPHGAPIRLTGRFDGRTLTFSGDSSGDHFTIHVDSTASLKSDGTFDGVLTAHIVDLNDEHQPVREHNQEMPWTAQRTSVPPQGTTVHSAR